MKSSRKKNIRSIKAKGTFWKEWFWIKHVRENKFIPDQLLWFQSSTESVSKHSCFYQFTFMKKNWKHHDFNGKIQLLRSESQKCLDSSSYISTCALGCAKFYPSVADSHNRVEVAIWIFAVCEILLIGGISHVFKMLRNCK